MRNLLIAFLLLTIISCKKEKEEQQTNDNIEHLVSLGKMVVMNMPYGCAFSYPSEFQVIDGSSVSYKGCNTEGKPISMDEKCSIVGNSLTMYNGTKDCTYAFWFSTDSILNGQYPVHSKNKYTVFDVVFLQATGDTVKVKYYKPFLL